MITVSSTLRPMGRAALMRMRPSISSADPRLRGQPSLHGRLGNVLGR